MKNEPYPFTLSDLADYLGLTIHTAWQLLEFEEVYPRPVPGETTFYYMLTEQELDHLTNSDFMWMAKQQTL